jgi:transposase InsO family protein
VLELKKYKSYRGSVGKICDNILKREFNASGINKKWATDITEFSLNKIKKRKNSLTWEKKLYIILR